MKKFVGIVFSALVLSFPSQTFAQAVVEVVWESPEKYHDVRPANESRKRFRESTFKHLDSYISELAEALPKDNKLVLKVSDLDLAGQVWPASFVGLGHGSSDIRLIKSIDIPRMNFSYELYDPSGDVIQQAEVKLKDMGFLERSNRFFSSERLRYEKNMLKRWFKQEFKAQLVAKEALVKA